MTSQGASIALHLCHVVVLLQHSLGQRVRDTEAHGSLLQEPELSNPSSFSFKPVQSEPSAEGKPSTVFTLKRPGDELTEQARSRLWIYSV